MGDLNKEDEDEVGFKSVKNDRIISVQPGAAYQYPSYRYFYYLDFETVKDSIYNTDRN